MTTKLRAIAAGAALCVLSAMPMAATSQEPGLVPHKAVYTVRLDETRGGVGLEAVSGSIAYGVQKTCGGWVLAQSGTMNMHLPTGDVFPQTLHYSSWESDDATSYRFSVTTEGDGGEVILGSASVTPGQGGEAVYQRPEHAAYPLPADTLFPVAHTQFMIQSALAAKTQVHSHIFEGTEVEGAKLLVVFISPLSDKGRAAIDALGEDLVKRPGWNFRLAYFDPTDQSGEPLYEIEADMLDNGIAPRWVLDYGDFSVIMQIAKIQGEALPDC